MLDLNPIENLFSAKALEKICMDKFLYFFYSDTNSWSSSMMNIKEQTHPFQWDIMQKKNPFFYPSLHDVAQRKEFRKDKTAHYKPLHWECPSLKTFIRIAESEQKRLHALPWASPWIPATRCSPLVAPWYLMHSRSLWWRLSIVFPRPSDKVPANWHTKTSTFSYCTILSGMVLTFMLLSYKW